jgi:hypothetical protein
MLNAPSGRLPVLRSAERLDPYRTWQFRQYLIEGITRGSRTGQQGMPPAVGKIAVAC